MAAMAFPLLVDRWPLDFARTMVADASPARQLHVGMFRSAASDPDKTPRSSGEASGGAGGRTTCRSRDGLSLLRE